MAQYLSITSDIGDIDSINYSNEVIYTNSNLNIIDPDFDVSSLQLGQSIIKQIVNPVTNYIYAISDSFTYVIDIYTKELISTINNIGVGWDIAMDSYGNVYVSYGGQGNFDDRISVISTDLTISSYDFLPNYSYGKFSYDYTDQKLYVFSRDVESITTTDKKIYRINTTDTIRDSFEISDSGIGISSGYTYSYLGGDEYDGGELHNNPFSGSIYVMRNGSLHMIDTNTEMLVDLSIPLGDYYSITFDTYNSYVWISTSNDNIIALDKRDTKVLDINLSYHGYISYNSSDSNIYISTTDYIRVFSTLTNEVFYSFNIDKLDKFIFTEGEKYLIGYNSSNIIKLDISLIYNNYKNFSKLFSRVEINGTPNDVNNAYGTLADDYQSKEYITINANEYIRRPRNGYENTSSSNTKWVAKWADDSNSDMVLIDISGDMLPTTGKYAYTGLKPLTSPTLRYKDNDNINLVNDSSAQRTVFDQITYSLSFNDDSSDISFMPSGIQTLIGFNSMEEGVSTRELQIAEHQDIYLEYDSYNSFTSPTFSVTLPKQTLDIIHNTETGNAEVYLSTSSTDTFIDIVDNSTLVSSKTNLEIGQNIELGVIDNTSPSNEYLSPNNRLRFKIISLSGRKLTLRYLDENRTVLNESTELVHNGQTIFLKVSLKVIDRTIASIKLYGQTEIEDERYRVELKNIGKLLNPEEVYIFKDYDLYEGGLDWTFLNAKRKELLTIKNDIYNYVGAYRSITTAINYFGYNDLKLYEYFQNIDPNSVDFLKYKRVEIQDIFDNNIDGWLESYENDLLNNSNYEITNLFNLSYDITDINGTNLSTYSFEEVLVKLRGLKKWLENNVVPLTHKILDITGNASVYNDLYIHNSNSRVSEFVINDKISPIEFSIKESYVLPIQSGSTVYSTKIDFKETGTFSIVDYFDVKIRTYKTYEQWSPFVSYTLGDKIDFNGKIFENVYTLSDNKRNNPSEFDIYDNWDINSSQNYEDGNIVKYGKRFYKFSKRTLTIGYVPWSGATNSCTGIEMEDNFYTDLADSIAGENTADYLTITSDRIASAFDVLDIIKEKYGSDFCSIIDRDSTLLNSIGTELFNLDENQLEGTKPSNLNDAITIVNNFITDYILISSNYKFKYRGLTPDENILLEDDYVLWDDITKWLEIDLEPVQTINEYRSGDDMLLPLIFTLDSKIDPYVVVECVTDNGYGQIIKNVRAYEIRSDADSSAILLTK